MKKTVIIIIVVVVLGVLFVPYKRVTYKDGGTREYGALTYTLVKWNRISYDPETDQGTTYQNTCIYFFPNNNKSIDELWEIRH